MRTLYARFPQKWLENRAAQIEWTLAGGKAPQESGESSSIATLPRAPRTFAVLPYQAVSIAEMELPPGRDELLQKAAMNAVEDVSPSTAGSAHVAVGGETSKGRRAVAVCGDKLMREVIESLSKAAHEPDGMIVDGMALPLEEGAASLIWNGRDGFLRVSKSLAFSLDSAHGIEPPVCLARVLELCAEYEVMPSRIDIYMEPGAEPPLLSEWEGKLGLPSRIAGEWDWREWIAISDGGSFNLMQGLFAPPSVMETIYPSMKISAALVAGLILAWAGGALAEWRALKREETALRMGVKDIFVTTFPKAGPALDPPAQMKKAIADMKARSNVWRDDGFVQLADRAVRCVETGHIVSMEYEEGKIEIVAVMSGEDEVKKSLLKMTGIGLSGIVKEKTKTQDGIKAKLVIGLPVGGERKNADIR